jgi:hypothetical protein
MTNEDMLTLTPDVMTIRESLLDVLCQYGVVDLIELKSGPSTLVVGGISGGWEFIIHMNRKSEVLRIMEKLNGTILTVKQEHSALIKCINPSSSSSSTTTTPQLLLTNKKIIIQLTNSTIMNNPITIKRAIQHRFSCCGLITDIDIVEMKIAQVTFSYASEAARAMEDVRERGLIQHIGVMDEFGSSSLLLNENSQPVTTSSLILPSTTTQLLPPPPSSSSQIQPSLRGENPKRSRTNNETPTITNITATDTETVITTEESPESLSFTRTSSLTGRQLFVVHSKTLSAQELHDLFSSCNGFESIDVKTNKKKNCLRGMSFVTFKTHEDAALVRESHHGMEFPPHSQNFLKVLFSETEGLNLTTNNIKQQRRILVERSTGASSPSLSTISETGNNSSNYQPPSSLPAIISNTTTTTRRRRSGSDTTNSSSHNNNNNNTADNGRSSPINSSSNTNKRTIAPNESSNNNNNESSSVGTTTTTTNTNNNTATTTTTNKSSKRQARKKLATVNNNPAANNNNNNNTVNNIQQNPLPSPTVSTDPFSHIDHFMSPQQHHLMDAALAETFDNVVGFHNSSSSVMDSSSNNGIVGFDTTTSWMEHQQQQFSPSTEYMYHPHQYNNYQLRPGNTTTTTAAAAAAASGVPPTSNTPYMYVYGAHPQQQQAPYMSTVPPLPHPSAWYASPSTTYMHHHHLGTAPFPNIYYQPMQQPQSIHEYPTKDVSRLHVTFAKPLPDENELSVAFSNAAPGLLYVSKHRGKSFAFVKYASSGAALMAMAKLHGSILGGQRIRVTLADPPPPQQQQQHHQQSQESSSGFVSNNSTTTTSNNTTTTTILNNPSVASNTSNHDDNDDDDDHDDETTTTTINNNNLYHTHHRGKEDTARKRLRNTSSSVTTNSGNLLQQQQQFQHQPINTTTEHTDKEESDDESDNDEQEQ